MKLETRVVHLKKEPFDVRIDRASKYGNPFSHIKDKKTKAQVIVPTRQDAIDYFERLMEEGEPFLISIGIEKGSELFNLLMQKRKIILESLCELKGKILACWCSPLPCHGDILVKLVKKYCK